VLTGVGVSEGPLESLLGMDELGSHPLSLPFLLLGADKIGLLLTAFSLTLSSSLLLLSFSLILLLGSLSSIGVRVVSAVSITVLGRLVVARAIARARAIPRSISRAISRSASGVVAG